VTEIQRDPKSENPTGDLFHQLTDIGSGIVRTTPPRSVLTNDANAEFELLFHQWVAPQEQVSTRQLQRARDPLGGLRKEAANAIVREFKEGYGRPLSRKLFTRSYALRGKSSHVSTFDLALHSGGKKKPRERLFQHLLVLPDAEDSYTQAAGLCWRWEDVRARDGAERELTAVLYKRPHQRLRETEDAIKLLRKEDIEVLDLRELREVAKEVDPQLSMA
jgi:hypothetical protein